MILALRMMQSFAKWSKPKPKLKKTKEQTKSFAAGDQKAAKLSKSQQELQNKKKLMEMERMEEQQKKNIAIMKTQDISLQQHIQSQTLDFIFRKQLLYLKGEKLDPAKMPKYKYKITRKKYEYMPTQAIRLNRKTGRYQKRKFPFDNYVSMKNKPYKVSTFEGREQLRRVGTIGVKMGMTTLFDKWGSSVGVTAIQLDRVQIVQIKQASKTNHLYQVQIGSGQRKLKYTTKPLLGHFIKCGVPIKRTLMECKVSEQCLLPVGYMMSVRHYTPGMFIDVVGKTVGHGFTGTIKKYGFRRQATSHGNSLTTRVLGSTGGRQDPGRVFKKKKMYGRKGGKVNAQLGVQVFKIDVDRNLLYVRGSVPGKAGTVLKIRDTILQNKIQKNIQLISYPTFLEQEGKSYAKKFSMYCGQRDPEQIEVHDNAYIVDDQQEEVIAPKDPELED